MSNEVSFDEWMANVDWEISNLALGATSLDLPDQTYWDWWDSGVQAYDAACMALEDVGLSLDEDEEFQE